MVAIQTQHRPQSGNKTTHCPRRVKKVTVRGVGQVWHMSAISVSVRVSSAVFGPGSVVIGRALAILTIYVGPLHYLMRPGSLFNFFADNQFRQQTVAN